MDPPFGSNCQEQDQSQWGHGCVRIPCAGWQHHCQCHMGSHWFLEDPDSKPISSHVVSQIREKMLPMLCVSFVGVVMRPLIQPWREQWTLLVALCIAPFPCRWFGDRWYTRTDGLNYGTPKISMVWVWWRTSRACQHTSTCRTRCIIGAIVDGLVWQS